MKLLNSKFFPEQLKKLSRGDLKQITSELRNYILNSVSKTGGHLSSNLGTVELTVALHYVYDTPRDRLVWDVGHQSYAHKILTGRKDMMSTLRKTDGMSGFPRREESKYDAFGTAHSSTSISAVLGMAVGSKLANEHTGERRRRHVAIIGDGAMSAGMAFEALNNAGNGNKDLDILVILNDNDMSISPPVGALSNYLARLLTGKIYSKAREFSKQFLRVMPPVLEMAKKLEGGAKGFLTPSTLFEEFGFNYFGPIDGHDLDSMIPALQNLRALKGPQFLHVVTKKGKGYVKAENDPILYHGPSSFDPSIGILPSKKPKKITYSKVFGDWLCDAAAENSKIVGITPAMREGSGMLKFASLYPDRYFDVGIAEQHAVTFAAGLACEGLKPIVAIYSTFLQRAYDQLIHDVALQNLNVVFAIDRAGLVGADGATHVGAYDLSYLRCVPNMTVMTPKDELECRRMLHTAIICEGPVAIRYPRGSGPGISLENEDASKPLVIGNAEKCREHILENSNQNKKFGERIAFLAFGSMVQPCLEAANILNATVINMRFVKPLDLKMLQKVASNHDLIVTVEEHVRMGGAGSACLEALISIRPYVKNEIHFLHLGLPDRNIEQGDCETLLKREGLDSDGIKSSVESYLKNQKINL
ncbi:MAG: 1-deoxy-D-xylulose-5-phosphate synthase [Betaproteobacteria bacterium TMED156]|nr:MAG: 1-deoxy-D-xylulose-5-phosphate synthase [Betaproteobacteria bacterium TMED156]